MRILVACERSGKVRDALIARGHDATSCDLHPSDRPGPHHQGDVLEILDDGWDGLIAHPVCKRLANSGSKHLYRGMNKRNGRDPIKWREMEEGAEFFRRFLYADIPLIAVENPIIHCHAKELIGMEQTQVIQPWHHGHKEMKATCLWLRGGLKRLERSNDVGPPPKDMIERRKWAVVHRMSPGPERERKRSETYQGIADPMADQWFLDT